MSIHYNIVSLIDILGLIQGLVLGSILIIGNRKDRPSLFIGLFLIAFSAELITSIVDDTSILKQYPYLKFLPLNFYFATQPFLYLYLRSLIGKFSLRDLLILTVPGVIEFICLSMLLFCATPQMIDDIDYFMLYELLGLVYMVCFSIFILRKITHHQTNIKNYYSEIQKRHLDWLKYIIMFLIIIPVVFISIAFIPSFDFDKYLYPVYSLINVIFIYWVGLSGFKQERVEIPIALEEKPAICFKNTQEEDKLIHEYHELLKLMKEERPFIEPDITLADLAQKMSITPKRLSHIINDKSGFNFNRFVNKYRVDAAKELLLDPQFNHLNVIGIGYEVGFNSKASFYAVFKQFTNTTPAQFKKTFSK